MPDELLTGGCLCGAVRFEVTAPLTGANYCHCTRCQRRTGTAASVSAHTPRGAVRITQGEEHVRTWLPPGDGAGKAFCSACGGALWSQGRDDPEVKGVRLGAFDRDPGVRPEYRQHTDSAVAWEPIPDDGLPRFPGPRPKAA